MNKIARSKNVLSVQLAHERTWQPRGGLNESAFKRLGLGQSASNQRLVERLEAENAQLRDSLVNLMLQIQALRERTRPSAYVVKVGRGAF